MIKDAAIILVIAAVGAAVSAFVHPKRPAWFSVEDTSNIRWSLTEEQAKKISENSESLLWIDARSRGEYEKGHIKSAILLNTDEWGDLMFRHQNVLQNATGYPIIVYCDGSACEKSRIVAERLRELLGLDPVYVLKGDWTNFLN